MEECVSTPYLLIEDQGAQGQEEQSPVEQVHTHHHQLFRQIPLNAGTPQQVVLIHPVVDDESTCGDESPNRDQCGVQESKPHRLDDLGVPLPYVVLAFLHQSICLQLGIGFLAKIQSPFNSLDNLEGVDQPEKGHENGVKEEHNSFLFNDPVRMRVVIVESDCLHGQGHECSGKK